MRNVDKCIPELQGIYDLLYVRNEFSSLFFLNNRIFHSFRRVRTKDGECKTCVPNEDARRPLTLTYGAGHFVRSVAAVVDAVAHQIRVDAELTRVAPEVQACMLYIRREVYGVVDVRECVC